MSLHPVHREDLERSGLTPETIRAAGIYTVPPDEIGKKLGGQANGVVSALAFPYPGCNGFERFKIWREEDKTGPKYMQKAGTVNRLYLPPGTDLAGDSLLILTEGEKKALALWQAGFQVVGLGGIWNWLEIGEGYKRPKSSKPIPDFDKANWRRPVAILFDSDGHINPKVRLAAFRLSRELAGRGATVNILFVPGERLMKAGADDFLITHGAEAPGDLLKTAWAFNPAWDDHKAEIEWQIRELSLESPLADKLKVLSNLVPTLARLGNTEERAVLESLKDRLKLRAANLSGLKADVKAARKVRESKGKTCPAPTLEDLEAVNRLHPAIDFQDGFLTLGFRADLPDGGEGLVLVLSNGQGVRFFLEPKNIEWEGKKYLVGKGCPPILNQVWCLDRLKAFLKRPARPQNLYQEIKEALRIFLDLPETIYGLLAAWTVGTYFSHLFTAFPFLHLFGPKETGKSKTLEALSCTCFNAWKGRDISAAAMGDTVDGQRGTMLIDQAEKLRGDQGQENNLVGLLADSYKKAGGRRRIVDISRAGRKVLEFSTYGPKAFASTRKLDSDLEDRCIRIPMIRTRKLLPDLEGWERVWGELRDKLYHFTLAAFKEVAAAYQAIPGDGSRIGELWRPLGAVLKELGVEESEAAAIRELFNTQTQETRHEPTGWELALLEALKTKAEGEGADFEMTPAEIVEAMGLETEEKPGPKWVGDTLSQYNLYFSKGRSKKQRKKTTVYKFKPARVIELCEIYLRDTPQNDVSLMSPGEKSNDNAEIEGTGEIKGTRPHLPLLTLRGHEGSCPPEMTCPPETLGIADSEVGGHEGHEKSGGRADENFQSPLLGAWRPVEKIPLALFRHGGQRRAAQRLRLILLDRAGELEWPDGLYLTPERYIGYRGRLWHDPGTHSAMEAAHIFNVTPERICQDIEALAGPSEQREPPPEDWGRKRKKRGGSPKPVGGGAHAAAV
jgi:hypothetical protein